MQMLRKTALVSLLILPAFFLLHNYNEIFGFIPIKQIIKQATFIYIVILLCYFITLRITASGTKSAIIVFFISVFVLFFGPIHNFIKVITFKSILSGYTSLLLFSAIVFALFMIKIVKASRIDPKKILYLNVTMICILAAEITVSFSKWIEYRKDDNLIYPYKMLCQKYVSKEMPDSSKPDIYFLVFDEYTNNKTLKKIWGLNNDSITDWLSSNDFYVPANTRANYTFSSYSISSTFNMGYIQDIKKSVDATVAQNVLQSVQSLSNNETFCILKKEQYTVRFLAPFRNTIEQNNLEHYFDDLIYDQAYRQTFPGCFEKDILWNFQKKDTAFNMNKPIPAPELLRFNSILQTIQKVKATINASADRKPQFVYGHFLITHGPHIFDSNGKLTPWQLHMPPMFKTYPAQIKYANKVMKEIVTRIRQNNRPNTIIIIEGDHGFRQLTGSGPDIYLPNFSAIYFPDKNYRALYDSISPVNIFRVIFNQYFHQAFPLLKDSGIVVKENKS